MEQRKKTDLRQDVSDFLYLLGFNEAELDPLIGIAIRMVEEIILNETNQDCLPEGLRMTVIYRAAGQYMFLKKERGQLSEAEEGAAEFGIVKRIKEGDTDITYAVHDELTPGQRFDAVVKELMGAGEQQVARYRRLIW